MKQQQSKLWDFITNQPENPLLQLLLLAVTVLSYSVMAMAVANSLFITQVGAEKLPLAFVLIGLCSLPAYGLFSTAIDRYNRTWLFRYVLLGSIATAVTLRLLLNCDSVAVYYLLLIGIFFQWDFYNNILYPSLLTDYFTSLEYKSYAPFIGIAQAVGTIVGGGLTLVLSRYWQTQELLWALPGFLAIAFGQLLYLERSQRSLHQQEKTKATSLLETLKTFPELVQSYPLVLFLAGSSFLLVIIYLSSEFLWFSIYGRYFEAQSLTQFLGLMRIGISLIQMLVLYGITRPLLRWLGVARLNGLYPLTTLVSFSLFFWQGNLPAAIWLHINGDAFYKGINLPIHQLNYNAIPPAFIGRIRALSDGLIYALGLIVAGIMLWLCHNYLTLAQITLLVSGLTLILLLLRLPMGKFYAQGLEAMIRSDAIDLDDWQEGGTLLPLQSSTAIRELLQHGDRYMQLKGLELAGSSAQPSQFLPEIEAMLKSADHAVRKTIVKLLANSDDAQIVPWAESLMEQESTEVFRFTAIEILIAKNYNFSEAQIQRLLAAPQPVLQTLGTIAQGDNDCNLTQSESAVSSQGEISLTQLKLDQQTQQSVIRAITPSNNRQWRDILAQILALGDSAIKREALLALTALATPNELQLAQIAVQELNHPESLVRTSALQLLATTRCESMLPHLQKALGDSDPRVRQQAANSLAIYGTSGLAAAKASLASANYEVVKAAITAIGKIPTRQASNVLFKYLETDFGQINRTRKWQQQIPDNQPHWQPLKVAIADYHQRLIQKVLYILSCLGYSRTVNAVRRILNTQDEKDIANAVEVLASLNQRRFVLPLIPLLEQIIAPPTPTSISVSPQWLRQKGYKILLEALEAKDRWLRSGALMALVMIPATAINDPDPVVKAIALAMIPDPSDHLFPTNNLMNRLLFLKNIPLFKNLSLDELASIDQVLESQQVLSRETIYTEGSWGSHFYLIGSGVVQIVKTLDGEPQEIKQLSTGQYFGEIALFDDAPRWDSAIALENCTLFKLEKKRFLSLIAQRPHIILEICRFLSQRLRETDKYLSAKTTTK
ncbi:MAG TPA: HEAT repeat domain-containing protein [Xenococcaceae cyanobacterium]